MAPIIRIIASTYCENLVALTLKKLFIPHTKFQRSDEISVRYLSVICVHWYNCVGNSLYFSSILMFCLTDLIIPAVFSLKVRKLFNDHAMPAHFSISPTIVLIVSNLS